MIVTSETSVPPAVDPLHAAFNDVPLLRRTRYYSPTSGRFNRLDPFAGITAEPLTFHKYGYASGDPANNIDPSGNLTLNGGLAGLSISAKLRVIVWGSVAAGAAVGGAGAGLLYFGGGYRYASNPIGFAQAYRADLIAAANMNGLEPELLAAFILMELSDLNRGLDIIRDQAALHGLTDGTIGVAQMRPSQLRELYGVPRSIARMALVDPRVNIYALARLLRGYANNYASMLRDTTSGADIWMDSGVVSQNVFLDRQNLPLNFDMFKLHSVSWDDNHRRIFGYIHDHGAGFFKQSGPGQMKFDADFVKDGQSNSWGYDVFEFYTQLKTQSTFR